MSHRLFAAAVFVLVGFVPVLGGWGQKGHAIIADLAWRDLTPAAREAIEGLLDPSDTIQTTSAWADAVRPTDEYRYTAPFHYVNLPDGAREYAHERDCPEAGCVVSAIDRYSRELVDESLSRERRAEALKFLVHFVGDLHQPLHGGRAADRGGNHIEISLRGTPRNLHSAWDSGLMQLIDPTPWPRWSERLHAGVSEADRIAWTIADARADPIGAAGRWAFESNLLAHTYAYGPEDGEEIAGEYARVAAPVIDLRLSQAGVRLGAMLNAILDR